MGPTPCPFCDKAPFQFEDGNCVCETVGCPAHGNIVTLSVWERRADVAKGPQQLKAKIAACVDRLDPLFGRTEAESKVLTDVTEELRQLSVV
jgi:hypothetical protein